MADISRDQFDEANAVSKKIFQQERYLLDADLNEAQDVLRYMDRRSLSCLVGHESKRFGDGFKVVGTGASLAVTIKAGFAALLLDTKLAALLRLSEDYTLSGFSSWSAERTDYVYIDIEEKEIGPSDDPDIVNPTLGDETCRDLRLTYSFAISEGAAPGSPPSGHVYIILATITKSSGSNIEDSDVTVMIQDHYASSTIVSLFQDTEYSRNSNSPAANLAAYYSESSGAENANTVLRVAFHKSANVNCLNLRAPLWKDSGATSAKIRINLIPSEQVGIPQGYYEEEITDVTGGYPEHIKVDIGSNDVRTDVMYILEIVLYVTGSTVKAYMQYPQIWLSGLREGEALTWEL